MKTIRTLTLTLLFVLFTLPEQICSKVAEETCK